MASWKIRILAILIILLLSVVMGIFTGIKNSSDYQIRQFQFDEIKDEVKVYRDNYGVPTIIAKNEFDLFFAQGYEMARDRLWQLEFFRSVSNGELSRLFGDSQLTADKYLKSISMKVAAIETAKRLPQEYLDVIQPFVMGINKYIELHDHNLPLEFILLGVEPKLWEISDVIAMQGVLSRTLSIDHLSNELLRNRLAKALGPDKALELLPIQNPQAETYYRNLNDTTLAPLGTFSLDYNKLLGFAKGDPLGGSNNWVVGPDRSATGKPIMANDPHLDLQTPGIWWQVHLYAPTFHVSGYSIPGTPGIIIGHNDHVTWGLTNTGIDAVDVFYFKTNVQGDKYWIDGEWKSFTEKKYSIDTGNGKTSPYTVKYTDYGPVLDPDIFDIPKDNLTWVMRWTLLEGYDRDLIFKSVIDYNRATSKDEFLAALEYFAVPGQNFVFATTDGDYGYQFTGIVPIRKVPGSGIIPQNGSDPRFGWNGIVPYHEQYRVINDQTNGYFATANQRIDPRDDFYITDLYAEPFRGSRINSLLEADSSITKDDMSRIQGDTLDLYAVELLDATMSAIKSGKYSSDINGDAQDAIGMLTKWNKHMDRRERGATIFSIFRVFLEKFAFADELGAGSITYEDYSSKADWGMRHIMNDDSNVLWDDVSTSSVETKADIVHLAFAKTIKYLKDNVSRFQRNWNYGNVHKVVFEHPMGEVIGLLNEGGVSSDGSEFTVKASGGVPGYDHGKVLFTQTHGPSMRYIAEAEPTWSNVWGIVVPGESEHFFVGQRGNSVNDWVNNVVHQWSYSTTFDRAPSFTFSKSSFQLQ